MSRPFLSKLFLAQSQQESASGKESWSAEIVHIHEELKKYRNPCQLMEVCILHGIVFLD